MSWNPTILIVDDESRLRSSTESLLKDQGYRIESAGSGAEACRLISEQHYDMVLLDMILPDMDGLEIMDRIKESAPRCQIPCTIHP